MASLEVPESSTSALLSRFLGKDNMQKSLRDNGAIISRQGTIRGVHDSVKSTVQNFKKMKEKPDASPMLRRALQVSSEDFKQFCFNRLPYL